MATITYDVAGQQAVEQINDELVSFYRGRPGYTVVVTEADAAELKGEALHTRAQELGIPGLSGLSADETRAAIVAATAPVVSVAPAPAVVVEVEPPAVEAQPILGDVPDGEVTPAVIVDGDDGVPVITAAPIDPPSPNKPGTKSRVAADTKEH